MFAIVETGGKQYRLKEGDKVKVERLDGDEGSQVVLDSVLAARTEAGLQVGRPKLEGARVIGTIVKQGRGPKITTIKYKRRKGYRRKIGHRQDFTEIRVDQIALAGAEPASV
jgi:large subunit ribosomal protein L21